MSDYTPTTWTVRSAWASLAEDEQNVGYDAAAAEFDRWLAEVKAAAWDEGRSAGREDQRTKGQFIRFVAENPYRT